MTDGWSVLFTGVETVVISVTVLVAWVSLRKFRDSRGIDFVINAESAIDPLYHDLINTPADLIRNIFQANYDLSGLSDSDVRAFPFMISYYRHVSRLMQIASNQRLDIGLSDDDRADLINIWMRALSSYKDHPSMQVMHSYAMANRTYNDLFLSLAERSMIASEKESEEHR